MQEYRLIALHKEQWARRADAFCAFRKGGHVGRYDDGGLYLLMDLASFFLGQISNLLKAKFLAFAFVSFDQKSKVERNVRGPCNSL